MNNLKNLMCARNAFKNIPQDEIDLFETEMYNDDDILCVDAVHLSSFLNEEGDDEDEYPFEPRVYTWFIPTDRQIEVEEGDTLVVEQSIGIGLAFVKAVTKPYAKTREQHENDIHPYCRVLHNLENQCLRFK